MRLSITSLNPLVWGLNALGVLPTPLLIGFWGMESSRALIAAVDLGVFDALASEPRSAARLARDLGYQEAGLEALLNALNGFGYLRRRSGVYRLTRASRRWLTARSRLSVAAAFPLYRVLWDELSDLEERVRSGAHRDFHADRDAEFWRRYETGLAAAARLTAPSIARATRLAGEPTRLLDVGGGHGAYSVAFCRRHPNLHATVLDFAPAAAIGRELVTAQRMSDRVTFREADLTTDEWGEGYDIVLLFNLLHVLSPEDAASAVARAHDSLVPGGTVVIVDAVHRGDAGDIDAVGGGSELLFFAINSTRAYAEGTMLGWVEAAGFDKIRRRRVLAMPEALITAVRPAAPTPAR